MVTENVSNNAEAFREKPKKWDETYKVDVVNNIDVNMFQKINGRNNINNTTILTSQFTNTFVISNPSIYDK
jgi:hypothetical protein